jgi:hypothetical protein
LKVTNPIREYSHLLTGRLLAELIVLDEQVRNSIPLWEDVEFIKEKLKLIKGLHRD